MRAERSVVLRVVWVGLWAAAACGSSGGSAVDAPVDRTADAATAAMCGADLPRGQACNALALTGPGVMPTCVAGTPPMMSGQGGTLAEGTYVLTALTSYNAQTCPSLALKETVELAGGCLQLAFGTTSFMATSSATYTVSGSSFETTRTCFQTEVDASFSDNPSTVTFTATATAFTLFTQRMSGGDPGLDVAVFTKQ